MAFHITKTVMFRDCDPAGIVFYPRYFEMVNDLVETYFGEVLELPFPQMHKDFGVPTVTLSAKFLAASRHGEILTFTLTPTRIGATSLDLSIAANCAGEERIKVDLTVVYVSKAMKPERWPDAVRTRLSDDLSPDLKEVSNG